MHFDSIFVADVLMIVSQFFCAKAWKESAANTVAAIVFFIGRVFGRKIKHLPNSGRKKFSSPFALLQAIATGSVTKTAMDLVTTRAVLLLDNCYNYWQNEPK